MKVYKRSTTNIYQNNNKEIELTYYVVNIKGRIATPLQASKSLYSPTGGWGGKGLWCLKGRFHTPLDFDNIKCRKYPMKVFKSSISNIY